VHQLLTDNPMVAFTLAFIRTRMEPLRERGDRGASALELAIIAAVLIIGAVAVSTIVLVKIREGAATVQQQQIPK
jgi:hypothetical protein